MKIFEPWFWEHVKYTVVCWFNPRQKWLTKQIPNTWCDKPELIRAVLFATLVDFVESEMDNVNWTWNDNIANVAMEIKRCYQYITKDRPELEQLMDKAYPDSPENLMNFKMTKDEYHIKYGEVNRLEALIQKNDDDVLETIVKIREYLWT